MNKWVKFNLLRLFIIHIIYEIELLLIQFNSNEKTKKNKYENYNNKKNHNKK